MISPQPMVRLAGCLGFVAGMLFVMARPAEAIPAFARKYQTSCQTCHIVFPKLNSFGEAFRLRGYRMPGETEDMVKEPPVSLGAPAYKRLWPNAVWPSDIPGFAPLAVNIQFADVNTSEVEEDGSVSTLRNDLQFPQELAVFGAGTMGEHLSFFSELVFEQEPGGSVAVEIEHAHLGFDSPFGPEDAFHFRIGRIVPNVVSGFQEMWIATSAGIESLFAYNPIGVAGGTGLAMEDGPHGMSVPMHAAGIEAYGMLKHRALWVAGLSNGMGPGPGADAESFDGNSAKDVYARFDYKVGGMGIDGYTGGQPPPDKNWRDNSVRLGVFAYRGDNSGILLPIEGAEEGTKMQDRHFLRTGVYASVFVQDLNVFGAYVHGTDTLDSINPEAEMVLSTIEPSYHAWFLQGDYLVFPWLQGTYRFETVTPADPSVESLRTGVLSASALIRANVKALVEYQRDLREGANHGLSAIVRFAF